MQPGLFRSFLRPYRLEARRSSLDRSRRQAPGSIQVRVQNNVFEENEDGYASTGSLRT